MNLKLQHQRPGIRKPKHFYLYTRRDVISERNMQNTNRLPGHAGMHEDVTTAIRPNSFLDVHPVTYFVHSLVVCHLHVFELFDQTWKKWHLGILRNICL